MSRLWFCQVLNACFAVVLLAKASADNSFSAHIVGGKEVDSDEAGWQVAIVHKQHLICSGSLLRKNVVLTAAACLKDLQYEDFMIRAGSKNFKKGGQSRRVREFIYHPEYKIDENSHNIALIKLRSPFNSTVGNIKIIKMPKEDPIELPSSISIFGWGVSNFNADHLLTRKLRFSKFKTYSDKKCLQYLSANDKKEIENVFCIGDRTKQVDVCNDDIGSPAINRQYDTQYGIVSENGACSKNKTIIVTSVAPHISWLNDILQKWKIPKKGKFYF